MKKGYVVTLAIVFALAVNASHLAIAQGKVNIEGGPLKEADWFKDPVGELNENHANVKTWITKWYGPDGNYENNGGFGATARKDLIEEGTGGKLTQTTLSTIAGLQLTKGTDIAWPNGNGGTRKWTVFEIDPANSHHMEREGVDNFDGYGIIVIDAPEDMDSVMSPAHDDQAQIWINGEKWYNNSAWTGAVQMVDYNVAVELKKGANVLVYRVGESGGDAYMNLHFDDATHDAVKIYPDTAKDQNGFFNEIAGVLSVDPADKLSTTWGAIKADIRGRE